MFVQGNPHINNMKADSYKCWQTRGYEKDCFHSKELDRLSNFPLTEDMYDRSLIRNSNVNPDFELHRAFEIARKTGVLKIFVIGGSVTYGHGCVDPPIKKECNECAWPKRVQEWFDESVEEFSVEIVNAALPGWSMMDYLHNIHKKIPIDLEVDLIIVDLAVNDAVIRVFDNNVENVKLAHEVFIRYVKDEMVHKPSILYTEGFTPPNFKDKERLRNMAEIHSEVTNKYNIPISSFRDAVWPVENSDFASLVWGENIHPDWEVHQVFADVTVYFLQKSYARFLNLHESYHESLVSEFYNTMGCPIDSFRISFEKNKYHKEEVSSIGWDFAEENNKGGFIGYGNQTSVATFDIPCSYPESLTIQYLMSYKDMGVVKVDLMGEEAILDGLWDYRSSLRAYKTLNIPQTVENTMVTFEVLSKNKEELYMDYMIPEELRTYRKFKIMSMECC